MIASRVVSTWIELKQKDGTIDALFGHCVLGRDISPRRPRWSVIRRELSLGAEAAWQDSIEKCHNCH
jgi:hypothetical protein